MDLKRLQKIIDKGIRVLSDHDDKKQEERYINLQNTINEAQDYVDKGNYTSELNKELYEELRECIKKFEKDRFIFILFLIILCGLLFIGVFYITYSHFFDHWYQGGHFIPPHTTKKPRPSENRDPSDKTTTIVTTTDSDFSEPTTKPSDDKQYGFVTVLFDNSSLIDLDNVYPMLDSDGLNQKPNTWKLSSTLSEGNHDYIVRYTINFIDVIDDIATQDLLDVSSIKFQLLVKNKEEVQYNSGVQYYDDYPEVEYDAGKFYRPIISLDTPGNTFNNNETLDFELRMWLEETGFNQNYLQGKKYKFNIFVEAEYKFME